MLIFGLSLLAKQEAFIYNKHLNKFNFNNKKTRRVVSSVIIIILVLAMVVPTLLYFL